MGRCCVHGHRHRCGPCPMGAPCCRPVPPFSVQTLQRNTCVIGLPRKCADCRQSCCVSDFRMYYQRRDLPLAFEFDNFGQKVAWRVEIEKLDFHRYLPLFFEGLCENVYPYKFLARQGVKDLLQHGGRKILPVVPQLIFPIKKALNTRIPEVLNATMRAIQQLVLSAPCVGVALVPYFRQILPVLNEFKNRNVNCGDRIDFTHMYDQNVGDMVTRTLEILEIYGGEDAYINIKYMVPTYESCMLN